MNIYDILLALYTIYIFNYFKTYTSWLTDNNILYQHYSSWLLIHPTESNEFSSKICPLGNIVGWLYGIFILIRNRLPLSRFYQYVISLAVLSCIIFAGVILNFNVVIYSLPILISELYCVLAIR